MIRPQGIDNDAFVQVCSVANYCLVWLDIAPVPGLSLGYNRHWIQVLTLETYHDHENGYCLLYTHNTYYVQYFNYYYYGYYTN